MGDNVNSGAVTSRSTEELIRSFQEEHSAVERKTYTKWINQHLARVNDHVTDIFQDLRSGERLTKLLEVLSGESVAVNERGVLRIHHMLNVERALGFLERKSGVQLRQMNIGAEDVVDGNKKITLGIVWLIILRFQIQQMAGVVSAPAQAASSSDRDDLSSEMAGMRLGIGASSASDVVSAGRRRFGPAAISTAVGNVSQAATTSPVSPITNAATPPARKTTNFQKIKQNLLEWVQQRLALYSGRIVIDSFQSDAWRNGLAFAATLHSFDPTIIPGFDEMVRTSLTAGRNSPNFRRTACDTLNTVFLLAEKHLGITPLLDAVDLVDAEHIDEKSVITYFSNYYIMIKNRETAAAAAEGVKNDGTAALATPSREASPPIDRRPSLKEAVRSARLASLNENYQTIRQRLDGLSDTLQQLADEIAQEDIRSANGSQIAANNLKICVGELDMQYKVLVESTIDPWVKSVAELAPLPEDLPVKEWRQFVETTAVRIATNIHEFKESASHLEQAASILKAMESRKAYLVNIELQLASGTGLRADVESVLTAVDTIKSDFTLLATSVGLLKDPFRKAATAALDDLRAVHDKIKKKLSSMTNLSRPFSPKKPDALKVVLSSMSDWLVTNMRLLKSIHDMYKATDAPTTYADILKLFTESSINNDTTRLAALKSDLAEREDTFRGAKFTAATKETTDAEKELLQRVEKQLGEMGTLCSLERYRLGQARKIYKFHKASQEVENWLTAAKLAILSVPIDLSKGVEENAEIKGFEEKLVQFEPTIKTLLLMDEKLSLEHTASAAAAGVEGAEPDKLAAEKQQLHERYAKICHTRANEISELWRSLRKTVTDINGGFKKAYKINKMTEAFQTVTSTLNGVEKEQNAMELSKKFDRDRLNMFESSLNDVGVVLERLRKDLSANKEVEAVVGRDHVKLSAIWETAKKRNQAMLAKSELDKKTAAYNQIAKNVEATLYPLYDTVSTMDLQGKSYQSSTEHAIMLDSIERKYHAFRPSILKMLGMLNELIGDVSGQTAVKKRHDLIQERWKFIVEAMGTTLPPSHIPKLRRSDSSSSSISSMSSLANASTKSLDVRHLAGAAVTFGIDGPGQGGTLGRSNTLGRGSALSRSSNIGRSDTLGSGRTRRNSYSSNERPISTDMFGGATDFDSMRRVSQPPPSQSGSQSLPQSPMVNRPFNFNSIRHGQVPSRANQYVPNTRDPLDVAVAAVVNECPLAVRVTKQESNPAHTGFAASPVISGGNKYWFGDMDVHKQKAVYCRLRGDMVIVRVGGGWQALGDFLLDHSSAMDAPEGFDSVAGSWMSVEDGSLLSSHNGGRVRSQEGTGL